MKRWHLLRDFDVFKVLEKFKKADTAENIQKIIQARKTVSDLILKVLTQKLCVREAIKRFPPDIKDPSIVCSWHALVHYEADEDFRKTNAEYAQEQDNYLEMMAFILRDGQALPKNIITVYDNYHEQALIPGTQDFIGLIKGLFRFITYP